MNTTRALLHSTLLLALSSPSLATAQDTTPSEPLGLDDLSPQVLIALHDCERAHIASATDDERTISLTLTAEASGRIIASRTHVGSDLRACAARVILKQRLERSSGRHTKRLDLVFPLPENRQSNEKKAQVEKIVKASIKTSTTINGKSAPNPIATTRKRRISPFQKCYEVELKKNPTARGTVTIAYTISEDGTVSKSTVLKDTIGGDVGECVARVIAGIRFGPPEGGATTIKKSLVFSATRPQSERKSRNVNAQPDATPSSR